MLESGSEIELACPQCGQAVAVVLSDSPQMLVCPNCHGEFVAPAIDGSTEVQESDESQEPPLPDDLLTAVRVRQLSAERRALYRQRSYCVVAAVACAVTIAQLAWMIIQHVRQRHAWGLQCTGYVLFIALAAYGGLYFLIHARRLHREAKQTSLIEPTQPPDFSTLDDGSSRVANLEEIR